MPILDVFWAMLGLFLFFAWIYLLVVVFTDLFRSDMSGWAKAAWVFFLVFLPMLGVLVYLIAQGGNMQRRQVEAAQAADAAMKSYIRDAAGSGAAGGTSTADEIARLAELRDAGTISPEDFEKGKAKLLT